MGVGILAKRVVLELGFSTNFVYSLTGKAVGNDFPAAFPVSLSFSVCSMIPVCEVS